MSFTMPAPLSRFRNDHFLIFTAIFALIVSLAVMAVEIILSGQSHGVGPLVGAVTLAQSLEASTNMLQAGVIETFINESPVLSRIPFMEIEGNAYQYAKESSLPGIAFRAVNAAYTESTGAIVNSSVGLKIMGGDADVDRFIQKTRSNRMDQIALQTRLKAKAAALKFTETFFEGDSGVVTDSFDGLRTMLTGAQVITAATNGAPLTLSMVDDLIATIQGDPDVLYADSWIIRKINALVRATGGTVPEPREEYGRQVFRYAGIPLVDVGYGLDGTTKVLGFDETTGSSAVTASMYAVKWGEEEFVSGITNGGIDVYPIGELETKPAFRTRIEWYVALAMFNAKGAGRLKGLTQA